MSRANFREGVAPTCPCDDPWHCTKRYPHRSWSWRFPGALYDGEGKRFRPGKSGYTTESAAKKGMQDAESDYRNGRQAAPEATMRGTTVAELFDWWVPFKQAHIPAFSSNSLRNWKREAREWSQVIGQIDALDLTTERVDQVLVNWGKPRNPEDRPKGFAGRWVLQLSVTSLNQRRATLRNMINDARVSGRLPRSFVNPAAGEMPSLGEALSSAFPVSEDDWTETVDLGDFDVRWGPSETAMFLDSLDKHRWEALFTQYVYSAARRAEWLGARRDAIRRDGLHVLGTCRIVTIAERIEGKGICPVPACRAQHRGRVLVPRTKTATMRKKADSGRWVPLPQEAMAKLNRHLREQERQRQLMGAAYVDHFLVFAEVDGSPIYPGAVTTEFERLVKATGLPLIQLKDLRSNAASLFLAAGIEAHVVARMTGHHVDVLDDYYHRTHPELVSGVFQRANDVVTKLRQVN